MLDKLAGPRRPFDFGDYVEMVRRNIRWIIGPVFAGIVISTVVAFLIDDTYESKAMIRIVPQQIDSSIVRPLTSQDVLARVQGMVQTILSRSTLANLITTYGLYQEELKREPLEDVLTKMRASVKITPAVSVGNLQPDKNATALQIQFAYSDRLIAMKVCSELVSKFVTTSSVEQLRNLESAVAYFKDEFDGATRTLNAADQKLQDYKVHNDGRLPEQMQMNLASMSALEQRLGSLTDAQTRNSEQQMMLKTQLHSAKDRLAAVKAVNGSSVVRNQRAVELDREIAELQSRLTSMQHIYTENHPDVQVAKDRLAQLKSEREQVNQSTVPAPENGPQAIAASREGLEAQAQVDSIQAAINASKVAEAANNRDIASVNAQLHGFEARIQQSPAGEKEYTELVRDHDAAKATFEIAQQKLRIAQDALNLERQKQGETLELVDPASTPTTPTAPKRAIYIPIGAVAGVLVGFLLVAIREVRDTSLRNLKDARLYTQLSILGSIPLLENDVVVQRRKQVMWVSWATATVLGLAVMGASVAHYYLSKT